MTPEADRYLQNADDHLERGQTMLSAGLNDDAGRAALSRCVPCCKDFDQADQVDGL